jgi:hypothetical protein
MKLEKPIVQKIMKYKRVSKSGKTKYEGRQIGVMVAGFEPQDPNNVIIGVSLCHKRDKFDHVPLEKTGEFIPCPGFGIKLAESYAVAWANAASVPIPFSTKKKLNKFLNRCQKYYKGKSLPTWVWNFLLNYKPKKPDQSCLGDIY